MISTIKDFLIPGSTLFLLLALVPGVICLYRQRLVFWGRLWLSVLVIGYWAMSTPAVARSTAAWMSAGYAPIMNANEAAGARGIVVLEAGSHRVHALGGEIEALTNQSALRALEAARLFRLLDGPWVVVTGGIVRGWPGSRSGADVITDRLVALGVPVDRIIVERKALTTREHTLYLPDIFRAHRIERFVLVTSPTHMRRSMKVFLAAGLRPIPSLAPAYGDPLPGEPAWARYVPSLSALQLSEAAMYDLLGTAYYWTRGWI